MGEDAEMKSSNFQQKIWARHFRNRLDEYIENQREVEQMPKRFSVIVDNLDYCMVCGRPNPHKHEVFFGQKQRQHSIKFGMVIPLCYEHHQGNESPHRNRKIDLKYKAQAIFESKYGSREYFREIFGKSYL